MYYMHLRHGNSLVRSVVRMLKHKATNPVCIVTVVLAFGLDYKNRLVFDKKR